MKSYSGSPLSAMLTVLLAPDLDCASAQWLEWPGGAEDTLAGRLSMERARVVVPLPLSRPINCDVW